ncbi:5-oxoprolinase subunit PxpA [Pacificibacter sp.]|uniref:LamB/YcsF family protein n=1 Tax=Pacificibacter sp. TaxID=1917866 RepID=UPI0032193F08
MRTIDVNSDLGEGFGPYEIAPDETLMPLITSANIACGAHAGDPVVMERTIGFAATHNVRIGGHVGYPDRSGFGRRALSMSLKELELETIAQLGALSAIAEHKGQKLTHANFHGALGNLSFGDADVARTLIAAMKSFDPTLQFVGLPNTEAAIAAEDANIPVIRSFLADRGYVEAGRLAPRGTKGALIKDLKSVEDRVANTLASGKLTLLDGREVPCEFDSVLVHSDTPGSVELAMAIRSGIERAGLSIAGYKV